MRCSLTCCCRATLPMGLSVEGGISTIGCSHGTCASGRGDDCADRSRASSKQSTGAPCELRGMCQFGGESSGARAATRELHDTLMAAMWRRAMNPPTLSCARVYRSKNPRSRTIYLHATAIPTQNRSPIDVRFIWDTDTSQSIGGMNAEETISKKENERTCSETANRCVVECGRSL